MSAESKSFLRPADFVPDSKSKFGPDVVAKLKEIDIANENVHNHDGGIVNRFNSSRAHDLIINFLSRLNDSVLGVPNSHFNIYNSYLPKASDRPPITMKNCKHDGACPGPNDMDQKIIFFLELLNEIDSFIDQAAKAQGENVSNTSFSNQESALNLISTTTWDGEPPSEVDSKDNDNSNNNSKSKNKNNSALNNISLNNLSRFGSPLFRTFLEKVHSNSSSMIQKFIYKFIKDDKSLVSALQYPLVNEDGSSIIDLQAKAPLPHSVKVNIQNNTTTPKNNEGEQKENVRDKEEDHNEGSGLHDHSHNHTNSSSAGNHQTCTDEHLDSGSHEHMHTCDHLNQKENVLNEENAKRTIITELTNYLNGSFGDFRRIDYGTGHELNFLCFLYGLVRAGVFNIEDRNQLSCLVLVIFRKYISLIRKLQKVFLLEPAGSRGVWGLDDYSFLPFLFGSAQLMNHPHLKPKSIRYTEMLENFSSEFIYFESIEFIMKVKSCSFHEHSPMLNDITTVKTWSLVNSGLMKMYSKEVLGKHAVIQHFIFSNLLPLHLIRTPIESAPPAVKVLPCCTDSIRFPSALAAKIKAEP